MSTNPIIENALAVPRVLKTLTAARGFDKTSSAPRSTPGQSQFNMRSAMDLDPRLGKALSKLSFRNTPSSAWKLSDPASSRFIDLSEIDDAVAGVQRDGCYVFKKVVDPSISTAIREFAEQAPCIARGANAAPLIYPRAAPQVGRYDLDETTGLQCAEVQEFATDPAMALVAQKYLGQPVVMDEIAFWWTTTQRAEDANLNAQMFHQDRDRLSFLKFFIFLTDVTPETGPHVYLKGSHRKIPWNLRKDGRISDDAVRSAGLWSNVVELYGPAGTVMAVDTIGLHKGKTPTAGDRLALESEFSTSLFGNDYERPAFTPTDLVRERFAEMPWVLQRYSDSIN
ncbi:unannotated protein [freshwater metagenome]|uniref:Unannotated protein n=1 Tax=freshwater metagenome TaxID=449393 RepID=A0A6J6I646_9ZZZZ|nr:hypothetical protein [Actinomycetota bacterium]